MFRIGEFSVLSKTTIKTLRYYEKEGLLIPSYVDNANGYRFYETTQLLDLSKIISLRQIGMTIDNIKEVLNGGDINRILTLKKEELESEISICEDQLSRINYLLEGREMKYEAIIKELPDYLVYYKEGIIKNFGELTNFIFSSADECRILNPNIKCITPDYCYVSYLDGEYKETNIHIVYAQGVTELGKDGNGIKFKKLDSVKAVCIYHKGEYSKLGGAYGFGLKWVQENNYEIIGEIRERYIDGMWNKNNVEDWVTEIQIPIRKRVK